MKPNLWSEFLKYEAKIQREARKAGKGKTRLNKAHARIIPIRKPSQTKNVA